MPEFTEYTPGTFCWIDTGTTDADASKAFYTALFGWEATDNETPNGDIYTMYAKDGKTVAGGYGLPPMMRNMGVPSHWMSRPSSRARSTVAAAFSQASSAAPVLARTFRCETWPCVPLRRTMSTNSSMAGWRALARLRIWLA